MKWSLKLGEVYGTGIFIHATFPLLLLWAAMSAWAESHDLAVVLDRILLLALVFAIVVLHEFGHAMAGRRYGVRTRDITLLPIGGLARMDRIPSIPSQELVIAAAGPAVNLVLAILMFAVMTASGHPPEFSDAAMLNGSLAERLLLVNLSILLFNLLPAFPMDGGRILRSLLAMRMDFVRATQVAVFLGQSLAWLMGFAGLAGNPVLVLIALFIWMSAGRELALAVQTVALTGLKARHAMVTNLGVLDANDPVRRAAMLALARGQRDLPVVDESQRLVGMVKIEELLDAVRQTPPAVVSDVLHPVPVMVDAEDGLTEALAKFYEGPRRAIPVLDLGRFAGLLTPENIEACMRLRLAEVRRSDAELATSHAATCGNCHSS